MTRTATIRIECAARPVLCSIPDHFVNEPIRQSVPSSRQAAKPGHSHLRKEQSSGIPETERLGSSLQRRQEAQRLRPGHWIEKQRQGCFLDTSIMRHMSRMTSDQQQKDNTVTGARSNISDDRRTIASAVMRHDQLAQKPGQLCTAWSQCGKHTCCATAKEITERRRCFIYNTGSIKARWRYSGPYQIHSVVGSEGLPPT